MHVCMCEVIYTPYTAPPFAPSAPQLAALRAVFSDSYDLSILGGRERGRGLFNASRGKATTILVTKMTLVITTVMNYWPRCDGSSV